MIKHFILATSTLLLFSCSDNTSDSKEQKNDSTPAIVSNFNKNISALEDFDSKTPITDYAKEAEEKATDKDAFTKDNIEEVLTKAKDYKTSIIIVEDHTIVKISNMEDCKASGSWGACMPMGKGYIKRGDLVAKKDYINNIIGTPDNQNRIIYYFN